MASIINASSSGSGGIVQTADASGVLQLQTNGTVALTVATSAFVGIGTTSPARSLEITTNNSPALRLTTVAGNTGIEMITSSSTYSWLVASQYTVNNTFEITPSTAVGGTTFTTPAVKIDNSGNLSFNSGYGSASLAYGCRAWVIFNGTAATVTKSGGVTSITRASAGTYSVNFSFTMPDATYSALTGDYSYGCGWNDSLTTTSFSTKRMGSVYGVLADNAQTYAAVFR